MYVILSRITALLHHPSYWTHLFYKMIRTPVLTTENPTYMYV